MLIKPLKVFCLVFLILKFFKLKFKNKINVLITSEFKQKTLIKTRNESKISDLIKIVVKPRKAVPVEALSVDVSLENLKKLQGEVCLVCAYGGSKASRTSTT